MNNPHTQIFVSKQPPLKGIRRISWFQGLGQGKCNVNLKGQVPGSKGMLQNGTCQKTQGLTCRGFHWPNVGQFEHQVNE